MSDSTKASATPSPAGAAPPNPPTAAAPAPSIPKPAPEGNPALRMLGLPNLPKKLPSRNWMIFIGVTTAITGAIIYDKREKKRATAKWCRVVAPLALEPIAGPSDMQRKLTVILASPPGDGLRVAQDHFIEYVKPILHASGLDWEFIQGRQQGDVRAAVAEKIRQRRRRQERPDEEVAPTKENIIQDFRAKSGITEYPGTKGDVVIGRHAWKEYIRGLHEGWLGPLDAPPLPIQENMPEVPVVEKLTLGETPGEEGKEPDTKAQDKKEPEPEKKEPEKPSRPPQIPPYNTAADYSSASLPLTIPQQFDPTTPIQFPHILGFSGTLIRLRRFFNRRKLADDIGREVAAVCFANAREWRDTSGEGGDEQADVLEKEEREWPKFVWEDEKPKEGETPAPPKELIWRSPIAMDSRITSRMRRFELLQEDEQRAKAIVVPEEEVEGWIKGSLRSVYRWGAKKWEGEKRPNLGNLDSDE